MSEKTDHEADTLHVNDVNGHDENEHHHHHHHNHVHQITSLNGVFICSIVLNLLFVIVEVIVGVTQNSLSLLSDAGHNTSDVFSLILALVAFKLAQLPRSKRFTYGLQKSTILISFINSVILLVAVGIIIWESINKFFVPVPVNGVAVSWTAGVGVFVNGITALLLMRSQKEDLNVKGAFLHMLADTLVSVGVVISGVIIHFTGINVIDPIISIIIAVVIFISTWHLFTESLKLTLDGTPEKFDVDEIEKCIEKDERVLNVHHIHIWAISTTVVSFTAHIVIRHGTDFDDIKDFVKQTLKEKGIAHSTLEFEYDDKPCCDLIG